jgi:pimeloyl-ACP methyl ester carboxylesterase
MSAGKRALKIAGVTAGVAVGLAGAAYATQRAVARGLRDRPDPDEGHLGALPFDEALRIPSHDGGSVYTVSRGDGPTIALSHGVTLTSRVWVKQFTALPSEGVRLVAFDQRGHGESLAGDSGYSIENLGWDVRTVLEGLDLRDIVLVGHSMGGIAVQAFVTQHPDVARERVRGLVLLSTTAKTSISASRRLRCAAERVSGSFDLGRLMAQPDVGMMLARIGFGKEPLASHVELTRELLASCETETGQEATKALLGLDLTAELPKIDLPTLVVCGSRDLITPPRDARRIASLIPGARLVMFEDAGHMLMLERTEELDRLLLEFAREVWSQPAPTARAGEAR